MFNDEQETILAAYWLLCDAEPPRKAELRRYAMILGGETTDYLAVGFVKHLDALSRTVGKCRKYPYDNFRRGTGLPGHRKVRASV